MPTAIALETLAGKPVSSLIVSSLLCLLLCSAATSQVPARKMVTKPRFGDYPVNETFTAKPASVIWPSDMNPSDPQNEKFIDSVNEAIAHGPNFAGHYSIAEWGLGSGISSIAVVDLAIGKIFREMPFIFLDVPWDSEGKLPYRGFSFRVNSRLLIASGCFYKGESQNDDDCGWKYYKWDQNHFVLLMAAAGPVPPKRHWQTKAKE